MFVDSLDTYEKKNQITLFFGILWKTKLLRI